MSNKSVTTQWKQGGGCVPGKDLFASGPIMTAAKYFQIIFKKKKLLQLQRSNFVAMQHQADMTFEWSLEKESALRQSKKKAAHMVNFRKLCSKQNKMDCKVTFESTSWRSQVHNVESTVCVYLDISCCVRGLCSDPSPPPSRERGKDHSFFKVSLSSLSHHTILWGRARGEGGTSRQDWLFIHPSPPLFLLLIPLSSACFQGLVSPLWPENFS